MRSPIVAVLLACILVLQVAAKRPRRAYLQTYEAYTRHLVIYFGFATALNLRATLLTRPMREAIAKERLRLMNPSPSNAEAFAERMRRDGERFYEVVFSAHSGMEDRPRFGTTDAHWNLRLLADGEEQPLVAVEQVRRPTTLHRSLYPHLNIWSDLWIARFERMKKSPRTVELIVGSGFGNGTLVYDLAP